MKRTKMRDKIISSKMTRKKEEETTKKMKRH